MFNIKRDQRRFKLISAPLSVIAIIALVFQSLALLPISPVSATYPTEPGCVTYSVWSMGYWKEHPTKQLFTQTIGNLIVNNSSEAEQIFNSYSNSAFNKLQGQLLALKFSITYSDAGGALVPGDTITLSQLAAQADALLISLNPGESDLLLLAGKVEQVNTVHTVTNCPATQATLIVKKHVINDNGGIKTASDFTMLVSAQNASQTAFAGSELGVSVSVDPGSYSVDESAMSSYAKSLSADCSGTIASGETKTCTITNDDNPTPFCRLEIQKTVSQEIANPGDTLTYTINFKNTGTGVCTGGGVRVEDNLDPRLLYVSETHSANISAGYGNYPVYENSTLRWNAHQLDPNETGQVTWTATIKPIITCGIFDIPNIARISANELNWQWEFSNTTHTIGQIICPATLIVKKHVINDNGGTKTASDFTMHVTAINPSQNTFSGNESGVSVTVDPGSYEVTEDTDPNYTMTMLEDCSGTIASGETKTCVITNNDNEQTFCRLEIDKQVDKTVANPGDTLTYTINFKNTGTGVCTGGGVRVEDNVDPRLQYVSETHTTNIDGGYGNYPVYENSTLRWNAHQLDPNETGQVTWTAVVQPMADCGIFDIPNIARISATQLNWQWVMSNTVHTVGQIMCEATLIVKKHVINDNGGQAQASDFTMLVSAQNPSQSSFSGSEVGVSITVEPGVYNVDEQMVTGYDKTLSSDCAGSIAQGESKTCIVTNNDNQLIYCQLEITKQVDKPIADSGDLLTYNLRVENIGTGVCTGGGVKIQDMVDPNLIFVGESHSSNITPGYNTDPVFDGSMLRWNAHDLTPGEVGEISWQATINELPGCGLFDIPNTARVSAQELSWQWILSNTVHTIVNIVCRANLIVEKIVYNDDGGTKQSSDFVLHVAGTNPSPADFPGSAGTNVSIEPGAYSVSETQVPEYAMSMTGECVGFIAHGETKTCTVINDDIPPEEAKLIVKKHVINDNGGTKVANDFALVVSGAGNFQTTIFGNELGTEISVEPGGYLVVENNSLGYSVTYDNCQGTITAGETKTCTVTNDDPVPPPPDPAYIIVIKHVSNDDGGNKSAADFTMRLQAGSGALNTFFFGQENPGVQTQVPVGDYNVTEDLDPAYSMTMTGDCTGTIAAGETKTCTINNNDIPPPPPPEGKLIIIKHVINDNGGTKVAADFSILVQAANNFQNIYAGQEAPGVMLNVAPGNYVIEEADSLGYTKTKSADCSGTIAAQEIKTCTITNDDPDKGNLIVIKHVINDSGTGTKSAGDFTMNVTAINPSQSSFAGVETPGVAVSVDPGDYSVDEGNSFNYTKTRSAECSGTIAAGETKTCTIVNNDPSGGGGCVGPSCGGGGCTGASCNPNPSPVNASITCGPNSTLSFVYGSDVNGISISNSMDFSSSTLISPVASISWSIPAGNNQTVYVKFQRNTGSVEIRQTTTLNCEPPPKVLSCTNLVTAEAAEVSKPNQSIISDNKGKILIQSEAHGEIWYLNPTNGLKYYIPGEPETITVIKLLADGITNENLSKIPVGVNQNINSVDTDNDGLKDILEVAYGTSSDKADTDNDGFTDLIEVQNGYNPVGNDKLPIDNNFTNQQKGRFFLQVEGSGQIWYVNPVDSKRYFIPGDSTNAFNVIASLGENISNGDIRQIPVGQEIRGVDVSAFAGCYSPTPIVLGVTELPRTGFPFDIAQLVILPSLAAYPWLRRRYSSALANHFAKVTK